MPAYFNMTLQCRWEDLYPDFVSDLYACMEKAGLQFLSGCYDAENIPREKIAAWNQEKLSSRFELGPYEHVSNDYRQTAWSAGDFTEIRSFFLPEKDGFNVEIIIPEDDVLTDTERWDAWTYRPQAVRLLEEVAVKLWQFAPIRAIQTSLEADCGCTLLTQLAKGEEPCLRPFAVLTAPCVLKSVTAATTEPLMTGRKGCLHRLLLDGRPGWTYYQ